MLQLLSISYFGEAERLCLQCALIFQVCRIFRNKHINPQMLSSSVDILDFGLQMLSSGPINNGTLVTYAGTLKHHIMSNYPRVQQCWELLN